MSQQSRTTKVSLRDYKTHDKECNCFMCEHGVRLAIQSSNGPNSPRMLELGNKIMKGLRFPVWDTYGIERFDGRTIEPDPAVKPRKKFYKYKRK